MLYVQLGTIACFAPQVYTCPPFFFLFLFFFSFSLHIKCLFHLLHTIVCNKDPLQKKKKKNLVLKFLIKKLGLNMGWKSNLSVTCYRMVVELSSPECTFFQKLFIKKIVPIKKIILEISVNFGQIFWSNNQVKCREI